MLFRSTMATSMCFNVAFVVSKNPSEERRRRLFTWFSEPPTHLRMGLPSLTWSSHGTNALQAVNPCGAIWVSVGLIEGLRATTHGMPSRGPESMHPSLFGISFSPPFDIALGCDGFHRMALRLKTRQICRLSASACTRITEKYGYFRPRSQKRGGGKGDNHFRTSGSCCHHHSHPQPQLSCSNHSQILW